MITSDQHYQIKTYLTTKLVLTLISLVWCHRIKV